MNEDRPPSETAEGNAGEAPAPFTLDVNTVGRVNFASAQNDVAVVREITLKNTTDAPLVDLTVTLTATPPVIREKTWRIDRLAADSEISISDPGTPLDLRHLSGLNEAEIGELRIVVDAPDGRLADERRRLELLARDEWGGIGDMAQILAAFVSPNDATVAALLKEASRLLERAGRDGSLDGYQSQDPGRAWMLAGAIWSAATGLGLSYALPPTSFEREGQKVRSPTRIRAEGLATCLDTTLLLAAAFEAAGLNPVVLFSKGHAWVGVWLVEHDFGYVTEPDVVAVRKAAQAREFVPIETTLLTKRPTISFDQAVDEGRRRLSEDREAEFAVAIDIARARAARIRPLAAHVTPEGGETEHAPAAPAALPPPLDLGLLPGEIIDQVPDTPMGRIERWQRKLLDLSLRNRLLNFKPSKQTLPFVCPDVAVLEDALADGKSFRAYALRDDDPVGARQVSKEERRRIEEAAASDAYERGQIAVPLPGREMNARLIALYRRARSDMQEGGTNTLFLAAGFLRWKKTEGEARVYRAPLLLIPVKLTRRSAQSVFTIRHHEDDVRFNTTLLEFLKRDFDLPIPELEGELPRDESGIDVPEILRVMRHKVREVPGFEVVEDLALSTFSFAKYLMWKDLVERTDQLRRNPLVKHLVDNPEGIFEGLGEATPAPHELDARVDPADVVVPLPADSSQMAAIVAASGGRDFVLVGPPGTGKSQTIANIISQCLANGRTVLFVAEKAAALDVVHRRLVAHGLGDAVLELHSNKTDRKTVLAQLGRSWDRAAGSGEGAWLQVTQGLRIARDKLNDYVAALHADGTQGFSIFDAIGQTASQPTGLEIAFASKDAHDATSFNRLCTLASDLGRTHDVVKDGPQLALVASGDWSFAWEAALLKSAETLARSAEVARRAGAEASRRLGLVPDPGASPERRALLAAFAERTGPEARDLSQVPELDEATLRDRAGAFRADVATLEKARGTVAARYGDRAVLRMPLETLDADWREAATRFWPFSALGRRKVRKLLQTYAEAGLPEPEPADDIRALFEMKARLGAIADNPVAVVAGKQRDADQLDERINQAMALRRAFADAGGEVDDNIRFAEAKAGLARLVQGELRAALEAYRGTGEDLSLKVAGFEAAGGQVPDNADLAGLLQWLDTLMQQRARISDWTRWIEAKEKARKAGLEVLVEALQDGRLEDDAELAFRRAYVRWWLPLALDASDVLRRFAHWDHEDLIEAFRGLDEKAAELAPAEVMRRIRHGLPTRDGVPRRSELGTLRHQLGLQRPSLPIRTLLAEMPKSFPKLAPCVLMSPLSIAQYLPAGQAAFDLVIFDEASQITTWDAIGAIARGRRTIIVGDPKQLPPTNFFGRADDGDEDLPEVERDMPSILDEVCAAGIPTRRLDWHYRSRDEALIAFSNHFYYGGGLVTFPAPSAGSQALRFHRINGTYARGSGRTNQTEAKAIVALIRQRLMAWLEWPEEKRQTLGVITFNIQQQSLILDLLDEARRSDPRLEWFFADEREEPVIVKNLENIQGDERDVMLFSITFGPDAAGKLAMNFGALNSEGGERRLNVAITRARREFHVFSSITAEQIDLARTRATGVRDLKAFLDYAERGAVALPARDEGSLGPAENPFEAAVAGAFRARGWEVRSQIGVSGYRIDLAVVNPDRAGAYLAGVECDGAQYHSSATARDRDKIRQAVLEGLGWNILRIWSTDWFRNPLAVTDRLNDRLEELLEADRALRAAEEERPENGEAPKERLALPAPIEGGPQQVQEESVALSPPPPPSAESAVSQPEPFTGNTAAQVPVTLGHETGETDPDRFYDANYTPVLVALIEDIVNTDGPLPLARLARAVAQRHGWQRTGRRIAARVDACLDRVSCHNEAGVTFVWPRGAYATRVPFRGLKGRSLRDVSRTEIAWVIDRHASAIRSAEDPVHVLARYLEIARLTSDARAYLKACAAWRDGTPVA